MVDADREKNLFYWLGNCTSLMLTGTTRTSAMQHSVVDTKGLGQNVTHFDPSPKVRQDPGIAPRSLSYKKG